MVPPPRTGSFSPYPAQTVQTGIAHSPHPSHAAALSASASPSTSSPTGSSSLTKIVVAQVYLLLSTIKEDKDRAKLELQVEQLRKLIDEHGMEVFSKYFTRLVAGNAPQIFPGMNRQVANPGNYHVLVGEMRKIAHDVDQAVKIAESVETGTEDIFRDFDLSTFMEHFKLDALEKTLLALAFKQGARPDLRTKADAILSTNFASFMDILSRPDLEAHKDLSPHFIAAIVDRFIQYHPPNFTAVSRRDFQNYVSQRYITLDQATPSEVLAAFDLGRVLAERPGNALTRYIQKAGVDFTRDEDTCVSYLQNRPSTLQLSSEQVAGALIYTSISQTQQHDPTVLTAALQRVLPSDFSWTEVSVCFDQPSARISSTQFLRLYKALLPFAKDAKYDFDIQRLWGYSWNEPEAQLSFVCAYASLSPNELDANTIPGLMRSITIEDYETSIPTVKERAALAVRHPLISSHAMSAIFNVALNSVNASQSVEAKRVFQEVVIPNLDVFLVTALDVPRASWAPVAVDTLLSLFQNFLYKRSADYDFVLDTLWRKDKDWVIQRLIDAHAASPLDLPLFLSHAVRLSWLEELVYLPNGFSIDLAALAHAEGYLDLAKWAQYNADRSNEMARPLLQFLMIKASMEMQYQRPPEGQQQLKNSTTLQVRTVSALLQILEDFLPKQPVQELITVQRHCITAYPRLINYGEGYDGVIDASGKEGNALPSAANAKMEEHYKKMYGDEMQVRDIVEVLDRYKHSKDPLDQDVFACMIHGLFDEYAHYAGYPLEALATTAVLFGGIISHKLISDLPLKIGLGMILEAVRDHPKEDSMYKFGLQALMQLLVRFREWPGFCQQLLQIPGLQNTEAANKAAEIVREHEEELVRGSNGAVTPHGIDFAGVPFANGDADDSAAERQAPAFNAIFIDSISPHMALEDPDEEAQDKIQFVLNNITESTLQSMSTELREAVERRHQQWFASHLVEERAKMQPNYHHVYLELVKHFDDSVLWGQVLRETYVSVARMLNSDGTMQNSTERTHLKNLGGWLGLLTLARDRPIKHRNIAFKQLLIEAHDTKRLIVVIPFVCKVLLQGSQSAVFRPPNPWLMDIIHLLIDLYHHAELKLNLKFEIEVLCKGLNLDHKSIEPSGEILNRPPVEETTDILQPDQLDAFDSLSLNGLASVGTGLPSRSIAPTIPDLGPMITIPPANEMVVSTSRLHEIVKSALARALQDIIQPVVDRSVTIAAISTLQMIRKDFVTEGDESRLRSSAVNMVKATAGSLALVTCKEPLRANFTNYMRTLSHDLPSGLPEGTIIMCVNSNLDLACSIIEKQAEERAVPDIEEMLEPDIDARRRHRAARPNEPYFDNNTSRWSMTIPNPYKLSPNVNGLNTEQMMIYEDFGRQPRSLTTSAPSHAPSASDATRSLANEVLQEQFTNVPNIPTPAETPSVSSLGVQVQPYPPVHSASVGPAGVMTNGRGPGYQMELRALSERINKLLTELVRVALEAREEHFIGLPRPHPVLDVVDAFVQLIIKAAQSSEELVLFAVEQIVLLIFQQHEDSLTLESLVHVLETVRKIAGPTVDARVRLLFNQQPGPNFLSIPLLTALIRTDLLDWQHIDIALSRALESRKEGSLDFLDNLLDLAIFNNRPIALFADFLRTLEAAWTWVSDEPEANSAERVRTKIIGSGSWQGPEDESLLTSWRQDQSEYVFEEWVRLCNNFNATDKILKIFIEQLRASQIISGQDDFFLFVRTAIDMSVDRCEHAVQAGIPEEAYVMVDALGIFISDFIIVTSESASSRVSSVDSILALITLVLNHHHLTRGELFNQRVFFRLLSGLLFQLAPLSEDMSEQENRALFVKFAVRLSTVGPLRLPGFTYGWLALLNHRMFMPILLSLLDNIGWVPLANLVSQLLHALGEQLKAVTVSAVAKDLYRSTFKLLVVLHHDFPEFLAANHVKLCASIPPHCTQLLNAIIAANPQQSASKTPDQVSKMDRSEEMRTAPVSVDDCSSVLLDSGILSMLDHAVQNGPSEDIVAQIAHTMMQGGDWDTSFGHVTVDVNARVIAAVVMHIGKHATERAQQADETINVTGREPEVATLSLLVHELPAIARYHLVANIVNHLRYPNAHTNYFSQVLLYIFGKDLNDPEETEIREDITRVLLERLSGFWPQPWGLMCTVMELLKNEKFRFFELPYIKADPEVAQQFLAIMQRA